ncbi:glycosyltransferase [Deinococcus taeanensis]|uniref:glycosyltransferase n=1 Tax=Deinococcus taeanensis TaxID=2737050 RepID=UPI001CDC7CAC|nr:glycosyltransferase [Deinococcus taeanensis]UBV42719.1 glycosyltransferase [Deinococcus taeanensis]
MSQPLKILFIGSVVPDTAQYRTSAFSRAGNLAQQGMLTGIAEAGAHISVLSFQPVPAFPRSLRWWVRGQRLSSGYKQRLVPFVNIPYLKQVSLACAFVFQGWYQIRRTKPHVLMSYNVNTFISAPLLLLSRLLCVPYVPVVYDVDVPGATVPDGPLQRLEYRWATWILPLLPAAVTGTALIGRDLMPGRPTLIVEGGLNKEQQTYAPTAFTSDTTFDIVFAGALEKYNGVDVLMDAMAWLPDHVRLHIAGQGRMCSAVQAYAAADDRIVYHGLLDMDGLRRLYAKGDLLVNHRSDQRLDSRYVFPSKLIEYLAAGIPVVSTRFRSLPEEYLPFLELLLDESPRALATGIEQVMSTLPAARSRAQRGQEFAQMNKSWAFQGRRILSFLETTIL